MTTRDPRTGRFANTANTHESREGKFATYIDMPVEFEGADPTDLAYDSVPRHAPEADELAQGGQWPSLHPRHPVLASMDEQARTRYGVQGMLTRDAARLHGLTGALAYVLGVDDSASPSSGVQEASDDH